MRIGVLTAILLAAASLALAQSQSQQPQPQDPTAQVPSTKAPPPKSSASPRSEQAQPQQHFLGEMILVNGAYYLLSGDARYKLEDQAKGKQFAGQTVEVNGTLDQQNVLHIEAIGPHQ